MKISGDFSDTAILSEIGARISALRLELNLTQADLAGRAGVSKRTVERIESGSVGTQLSGFIRICRALGIVERLEALLPEPGPSPLEQLKLRGRRRRRASGARAEKPDAGPWTWGDGS
jgi:transcriptional regulator with XRE-family HTH domain